MLDPKFLANSLILMGEIGGNDYNSVLSQRLPYDKLIKIVPNVVQSIGSAIAVSSNAHHKLSCIHRCTLITYILLLFPRVDVDWPRRENLCRPRQLTDRLHPRMANAISQ